MKLTMTKELEIKVLKIEAEKDEDNCYTGCMDIYVNLEYNICGRKVTNYLIINSGLLSNDSRDYYDVYDNDEDQEPFEEDDNFYDFFKNTREFIECIIPDIRKFAKENRIPYTFRSSGDNGFYINEYEEIHEDIIRNQMCIKWYLDNDILKLNNCILNKEYKIDLEDLEDSLSEAIADYNSQWNEEAIGKFNWN